MFRICAVLAIAAVPCLADVQITTSYNADGQSAETTIWSKGNRMRYEYGNGVVMLRYCDERKMIQLDEKAKSFLLLPIQEPAKPGADSKDEVTDTGERKDLFGRQARHLKLVSMVDSKEGKKERTETDGWYVDLRGFGSCFAGDAGAADRGYPASYTIVSYGDNGKPATKVTMRIVSMAETPLASSMFDVPSDYRDSTPREIPRGATPKAPGSIRIGALPVHDKSNPGNHNDALYGKLVAQLIEAKINLIQLDDGSQEAIDRKARETACDFVLYTEVASIEKPATGKVGGLLRKAPGLGHVTGGDGMEAHVEYRLVPGNGGTPVLASSAIGKAGTAFNLKGAVLLASNLVPAAMAARMFSGALNPAMMNALVSGRGYGASMASADPMMGGLTSLIRAAMPSQTPQGSASQSPTALEALAAAIDLEGKAVIAQVTAPIK
jgi:hypothetical protein